MNRILEAGRAKTEKHLGKALVFDTTAFYAGVFQIRGAQLFAPPSVLDEAKRVTKKGSWLEVALEAADITSMDPSRRSVEEVASVASRLGEESSLSATDAEVVALALDLRNQGFDVTVVSDDFTVENLVKRMGLVFVAVAARGIRRVAEWLIYCPGCGRTYGRRTSDSVCIVCGTKLRRKMRSHRDGLSGTSRITEKN